MNSFPELRPDMPYEQLSQYITEESLSVEGPLGHTLLCQIMALMPFETIARMFRERPEVMQQALLTQDRDTTPLMAAVGNPESRDIVQLLLEKGAKINHPFLVDAVKTQEIFERIAAMDPPGWISELRCAQITQEVQKMKAETEGATALWVALKLLRFDDEQAKKAGIPTIRFLLEQGAEVGREDTLSPSERDLLKQLRDEMLYGVEGEEMAAAFAGEEMAEQFVAEAEEEKAMAAAFDEAAQSGSEQKIFVLDKK